MERRFPQKRFVALGSIDPGKMGLSDRRTHELRLSEAWRQCAGERLAKRARIEWVRRGVLALRPLGDDAGWRRTIEDLAPDLAADLAFHCPYLRLAAVVVLGTDGRSTAPRPLGTALRRPQQLCTRQTASRLAASEPWSEQRLQRLAERYLARSSESEG